MSIAELGSLGEFVGSMAVVLSVIYLTYQLRHNSKTAAASFRQAMSQTFLDFNRELFADQESTRIWRVGRLNLDDLDELEQARFSGFALMALSVTENAYFQGRNGQLDRQYQERNERITSWFAEQPGFQSLWPGIKYNMTEDFQQYFESLIDRHLTCS